MKRSSRAGLRGLFAAVLIGTTFPVAFAAPQACAGEKARAALVVDTGDTESTYCVTLPADEVSGLQLIELAGEQHGLSYRFGFGGEAVCMLDGVGATGDDCFEEYPDFWGFWRGDGDGGWSWSGTGAGSARVGDGDIHGWSWGSGSNGESHPAPPATTYGAVCPPEARPAPGPPRRRSSTAPKQAASEEGTAAPPTTRSATAPDEQPSARARRGPEADEKRKGVARKKGKKGTEGGSRPPSSPRPSPAPRATVEAPVGQAPASGGPPPFGLAALGAAASFGAVGYLFSRRRRQVS